MTAVAVELLAELVRAPSPNPPGDERAAVAVCRTFLQQIPGVEIEEVGVAAERPMLVATLRGAGPGPELTFAGHIDTVPAGDGWTYDPFGAELADGRMYGRGTADMKGGIAGFLAAIDRLSRQRDRWHGVIVAHIVPDEEPGGHLGTQILLAQGRLTGDAVIVAEPSELYVYRAQKGNIFARARYRGRSAHGSTPHLGENAISHALHAATALETDLALNSPNAAMSSSAPPPSPSARSMAAGAPTWSPTSAYSPSTAGSSRAKTLTRPLPSSRPTSARTPSSTTST